MVCAFSIPHLSTNVTIGLAVAAWLSRLKPGEEIDPPGALPLNGSKVGGQSLQVGWEEKRDRLSQVVCGRQLDVSKKKVSAFVCPAAVAMAYRTFPLPAAGCPSIANSPDPAKPVHPTVEASAYASSARGCRPATSHQSSGAVRPDDAIRVH